MITTDILFSTLLNNIIPLLSSYFPSNCTVLIFSYENNDAVIFYCIGLIPCCSGGAAQAVCTEFGTQQLAAMQLNLDLNKIPKNGIRKVNYKWGDDVKGILMGHEAEAKAEVSSGKSEPTVSCIDDDEFNVILMGDLLYICLRDQINEALANTIVDLLSWNTKYILTKHAFISFPSSYFSTSLFNLCIYLYSCIVEQSCFSRMKSD